MKKACIMNTRFMFRGGRFLSVFILVLTLSLFSSCSDLAFNKPIKEWFKEYTETAAVSNHVFSCDTVTDKFGNICLQSDTDCRLTFYCRNPQKYNLNFEVSGLNSAVDFDSDSKNLITIDLTKEDLANNDAGSVNDSQIYKKGKFDCSLALSVKTGEVVREFDSYNFSFCVNTIPPVVQNSVVKVEGSDTKTYVLCFNLPSAAQIAALHKDLETLTINGKSFPVSVDSSGNIAITGISKTAPATLAVNSYTNLDFTPSGQSFYYSTNDPQMQEDSRVYNITLCDKAGLSSFTAVSVNPVSHRLIYHTKPEDPASYTTVLFPEFSGTSLETSPSLPSGYEPDAEFDGWYTQYSAANGVGGQKLTSIAANTTSDVHLYAKWKYKVTLYTNPLDLTKKTEEYYVKEKGYTFTAAQKPSGWGAEFDAWYSGECKTENIETVGMKPSGSLAKFTAGQTAFRSDGGNKTFYAWFKTPDKYSRYSDMLKDKSSGSRMGIPYYVGIGGSSDLCTYKNYKSDVKDSTCYLLMQKIKEAYSDFTDAEALSLIKVEYYKHFDKTNEAGLPIADSIEEATNPSYFHEKVTGISATETQAFNIYACYTIDAVLYNKEDYAETGTFEINHAYQLKALMDWTSDKADAKNFSGKTIKLTDNITLTGGNSLKGFKGTFDGNGYEVKISKDVQSLCTGILTGTIKNLTISQNGQSAGRSGVFAVTAGDGALIENCVNNVKLSTTNASTDSSTAVCAGFVGTVNNGTVTIKNCTNYGGQSIYEDGDGIEITNAVYAGFAGYVLGESTLNLINCTNNAGFTQPSSVTTGKYRCAMIGKVYTGCTINIQNCSSPGNIGPFTLDGQTVVTAEGSDIPLFVQASDSDVKTKITDWSE